MYTVTKIEEQKKDATRVSVFINGAFDFGISLKALKRYEISEGQVLDETTYRELLGRIQLDKAKYYALDYLSRNSKTEMQVRDKLVSKEYSMYIVDEVMTFLKTYRYVDDAYYAKRYAESKATYAHKSARHIQSQLYLKGIRDVNCFEVLENMDDLENENVAYFLMKYKYKPTMTYQEKHKIMSKIMGRGFSYEIIQKNINNLHETWEE